MDEVCILYLCIIILIYLRKKIQQRKNSECFSMIGRIFILFFPLGNALQIYLVHNLVCPYNKFVYIIMTPLVLERCHKGLFNKICRKIKG